MSEVFSAERLLLNVAEWAAETTSPNAGAGTAAAIGSWWQRPGAYPGSPTEIYLKGQAQDTGWLKQNIINLNVFNVKDPAFGAKGDGITDDTAAIQAAVDAANAAGGGVVYIPPVNVGAGQFYRLKRTATLGSVQLSNYHNITFMGDGFASMIEMFDDSGAVEWNGFEIFNGSTDIKFDNVQLSGAGITNQSATALNSLIRVQGFTTDAIAGITNIAVYGMYWGAVPSLSNGNSSRFRASGDDALHAITNITASMCGDDGATVSRAIQVEGFFFNADISYNYLSGSVNSGFRFSRDAASSAVGRSRLGCNQINAALDLNGVLTTNTQTDVMWNTTTAGSQLSLAATTSDLSAVLLAAGSIARGNIHSKTVSGNAPIVMSTNASATLSSADANILVEGNVVVNASSNVAVISAIAPAGFENRGITISDNVLDNASATTAQCIVSIFMRAVAIVANICLVDGNTASQSTNVSVTSPIDDIGIIGNLVMGTGVNSEVQSILVSLTTDIHSLCIAQNLTRNANTGILLSRSGAPSYLNWRSTMHNNMTVTATASLTTPPTNVGATQEGSAGPGTQVVVNQVTPVANVTAPKGSLCAHTVGGQATAIWYKESGAGVSGGTAGWFGIGGYDLVFGALNLSTTLTALFLAPGGDGLATPSATEIQAAVTRPATVRNLRSKVAVAGTGAGTVIHTVRKNGVDTTLTVTVTNTSTGTASDTTHSFTVVAGDLLSVKITKTATITTAQTNCADTIEIV